MRTLVRWAVKLYPAAWRARYGSELEALMEDSGVRGGDVWDLVRGAMFMQMTSLNFGKIVAGFTLAGVLAAGIWAVAQPRQYVSTAVMRMSPAKAPAGEADNLWRMQERSQRLQRLQHNALSRKSLASIIQSQNLFREDRKKRPLEDVIQEMRSANIRIKVLDEKGGTFAVNYTSADPAEAQAAARAIVAALMEQNLVQSASRLEGPNQLEVIDPASLPSRPMGADRRAVMVRFVGFGLALGLVCGSLWWVVRRSRLRLKRIGAFAAAGMAGGVVIALMIPNEYISTAVLRTADPVAMQASMSTVLSEESVAALIRRQDLFTTEVSSEGIAAVTRKVRNQRIRVQSVEVNHGISAYVVSFQYPDRFTAQRVTKDLVEQFMGHTKTELLDPASDPMRPSSPNRMTIALLGIAAGALLGLTAGYLRRGKLVTA